MPLYTYRCEQCDDLTEVQHGMKESPNVSCETCGGPTHRIILNFPHIRFDWKHYQSADDNLRLTLHAARAGRSSPASEQAGGRT